MLGVHLLVDCSGWTGLNMTDHAWTSTRRYRLHAYGVSPCDWIKVPEWSSHGAMGPCTRPRGHLQTCLLCACAERRIQNRPSEYLRRKLGVFRSLSKCPLPQAETRGERRVWLEGGGEETNATQQPLIHEHSQRNKSIGNLSRVGINPKTDHRLGDS